MMIKLTIILSTLFALLLLQYAITTQHLAVAQAPTAYPTTRTPTKNPTRTPTTKAPTKNPTRDPTRTPTTKTPTKNPTNAPTTRSPTTTPTTVAPTTATPTKNPTRTPTTPAPTYSPVPSSSPIVPDVCSSGWTTFNGRCFINIPVAQNWGATEADCNGVLSGATLASLNSAAEVNFIKNTFSCTDINNICWIGGYQVQGQANDQWQWKDGTSYLHSSYTGANLWLSGEPNNAHLGTSTTADCMGMYDTGFTDLSCSATYKGICVATAACRAGYYKTSSYSVTLSPTLSVSQGVCTRCPAGKYRTLSDAESQCIDCDAGYMGSAGAFQSTCTSPCPDGYYCPKGTATGSQIPCPAGKYGNGQAQTSAETGCTACAAGKYCTIGSTSADIKNCQAGYCGFSQASTATCSQACTPGYYCPTGSECPSTFGETRTKAAWECGGNNVYCPSGSQSPVTVQDGYYSIGGTGPTTRSSIVDCEKGYYCTGGVRTACPAGRYGPSVRLTSASGCLSCNAGYFCDLASISPNNDHCAPTSAPTSIWTTYYCPAGTSSRLTTTGTEITTPTTAPTQNREGKTTCPQNSVCANGVASSKLSWGGSTPVCGSTIKVAEMSAANTILADFDAVLSNLLSNPGAYTITYSLQSFDYYNIATNPQCSPTTAAKNGGGLFSVNPSNGQFFLSAATLNFEVCLPIIDIKYAATIRATAVGESTTTNLDCTVYVEVTDVNDQPKFSAPTSYRMIKEKQLKNTPVSRCDADAVANFGCPVNEGNLDGAILATDEDDGSALTYTFDSGNEAGFFKINPCTGVISYSDNYEVSFSFAAAKPRFTFVVRATDDGNGGRFATKFTTQTVNLYLININDAPVLPDPGTGNYFTIAELQAAGTSLTPGLLTPTDEDGDTVTLTLITNDANAFTLDSNLYTIKTSAAGALGINFETSKKVYQIQVLASDGVASTVQTYKIGVTNANDPPVFDSSRLVFYIEENKAAGSVVCSTSSGSCTEDPIHKLLVTDEDNIGTDVTTFSLLDNTDLFTVDSNGYIKVVTPLDFEADQTNRNVNAGTGRRIQVTVRATSSGVGVSTPAVPKSTTTTITIYIVDVNEAPIIGGGQPLITSTLESWPVDTVLSLNPTLFSAVDPDNADTIIFGATAPVQTITYEMGTFGGTSGLDGSSLFSVATTVSGALQVKVVGSLLNAPSNVACGGSSGRCYQFTLVAKDNGGPRQQSTATVTVRIIDTNQPPVFSSSAVSLSVSEDPTVAYAGITYSATDPDAGTTLSFAVVGGTGTSAFTLEGAGTNQFKIKKTAAAMTVENPLINFESVIKSWTLRVRAYDAGPSSYIGQVCKFDITKTIVLVGCGDTGGAYCYEVDERCYETCLPTTVSTKAVIDARPRINGYFCDYNGETKVGSYPDYAETTFTIAIDDANDPPLIVDDDNNAYNTGCKLSGSVSSVLSTIQRAKGDLSVIDEDDNIPSATFKGAPFVFTATDAPASFWNSFTINSATGVISSKALTIPQGTYSTNITVTDSNVSGGTKSSTCVIEITSSNLNRPPVISVVTASVTINENTATGTPLNFGVSAIDPESQTVTFSTSVSGFWTVSSTTGVVTTSDSLLDYESSKNLGYKRTLLITATDSSGATDSKLLTINIADVNEAPYWKTSLSTIQVPENTAINALVGSSLVSSVDDPDTDAANAAWRTLTFSMTCGGCPFAINTGTGQIYPTAALDFETLPNSWTATITVSDGGTPSLSSSTTVTIQLTNFNEAPFFKTASPNLQIAERDTSNQDLLFDMSSIVGDPDASDPVSSLTFTLGAPGNSLFTVTNGWLQLKTGVSFDYESVQSYTFTVSIQDSGGLSASQSITVTVTDVNDMSILSVSGGTSGVLSCSGGEQLNITGTNFGFKDHGSNPAHAPTVLEVTYWYTTTNVNDVAKIYTATGCAVTSGGNTEIICNSVVGVGTGLNFKIRLGVTSTSLNENSNIATLVTGLKYSPPQITTVSSSAVDMPTVGGTAITIDGTCLGIENDGQKMNHGLTSGRDSYIQYCSVSACYVPVCTNTGVGANNRWSCTSRPGIGKDIYWNIRVAGQTAASSFVYGTYGRPVLDSQSFTDLPTTGVFSSNMVISGTNFGDTNEVPSTAKVVFTFVDTVTSQSTTEEYALTGCKVTSAAGLRNQVTCTGSAPAVGTAGSVILEFGGLSNLPNQVTATYQRATLTAIDGNGVSKFETIGGQLVTLTGTSFGPACGVAASNSEFGSDEGTPCGHLLITYSNGSKKQSNQSITLSYRPTCAIVSNTRIVCKMAPGSGANHVWSITIGQRPGIIGIDVPTTSYVSPTVGAYSGDGSKNALTQGGQTIYISGSNFGPADGASVEAYYGNQLRPKEFYAGTCAVTTAHQVVTCTTSQGVGSGLVWVVYVDGLESRSELMSYGPPAVASFPNYPAAGLSPDGGFSIILSGSNFGPTIANSPGGNLVFLQKVSYGPSTEPGVYEATDCVVNSHTQITCKTAPGIGITQAWSVTVEGQTSLTTSFRTSYVPLELQSLSVTTGKTNGGYTSRIRGKGLAICDPNAAIRIVFGDTTVNGGNTYNDGGAAKTCPSTESRLVEFVVPPRTGARVVSVTVRMSSSKHSQTVSSSQSFSFTYDTPVIDQVYAEPGGAAGAVAVTLVGTNFCASEACCTTYFDGQPAENVASHGHDKIKFYAPRAGSTYIKCIDGFSTVPKQFEASSPFIAGTIPRLDSLEFSTTGGDLVEVWGVYFGSFTPNVTVGSFQATVISHTRVECNDPAQPATMLAMSFDVGAPCFKTVIKVPQGGGKSLPLVVTTAAGEQKSLADDSRFEFLSYISPVITAVSGAGSGKRFPTPGSLTDIVTITGTNFYITGSISIGDSAEGISCTPVTWTHNSITCRVGEGEGTDLKWSVVVEGERSAYFGDASNSVYYSPPSGLSFTSSTPTDGWSTQGAEIISITGSNLGRNLKQTVTIGGRTCSVTASGHTQVSCSTPEGEGINLVLSVTVGGQSANSPTPFSYGPPKVTSISPTLSPTRATNPNTGDSLILIINGKNFGYDVVSAYLKDENILLGERNSQKDIDQITKPFIVATHTQLRVYIPSYYGKNLPIKITVKGQSVITSTEGTMLSYVEPAVTVVTQETSAGTSEQFPTGVYTPPPPNAGFGTSTSGRRLDTSPYGDWESEDFSACTGDHRIKGIFWRVYWSIAASGAYTKTVSVYSDSDCSASSLAHTGIVTGKLFDLGTNPSVSCAQSFEDAVDTVVITPTQTGITLLNQRCTCPTGTATFTTAGTSIDIEPCLVGLTSLSSANQTCLDLSLIYHAGSKYGMYVIVGDTDLYISKLFPSISSLYSAEAFGISDTPSAVAKLVPTVVGPVFPTDGCYIWEDNNAFNARRRLSANAQRKCLDIAFLTLTGSNFGFNSINATGVLRVTFVNPATGDEFEASTTSSEGNHLQICTETMGCVHTHELIKVWVPYGSGRGLRVKVQVGNQAIFANVTVNYGAPEVDAMFPGTIFRKAAFQNAEGERVVMQGSNFGWTGSRADVLINGRRCSDTIWNAGSDGEPYVECIAPRDTVGPKSVFACIGNQTYISKVFKTDPAVLAAGEAAGAWADGVDVVQSETKGYGSRVFSWTVTRCPKNKYGRLFELCTSCPVGASCGIGSFAQPVSQSGFYGVEINVKENPERAALRCSSESSGNETELANFPDAVVRDTCYDFVKCEPAESCSGGNECAGEYRYALDKCEAARGLVRNGTQYVSPKGVVLTTNACGVVKNPYTGEYEGVHSDCRGNLTLGAACDWQRPWECSMCELKYPTTSGNLTESEVPVGECTCTYPTRCALCTIGTHYRFNNACKKCPQNVEVLITLFILAAISACGAAYYLSKKKINLAFVAIAVDYFQILAVFASTRVPWPDAILRLFEIMSLFNINIDIAAPECLLPSFEYEVKFYATEFLPLAALGVLLVIHLFYTFYKLFRDGRRVKIVSHLSKLISVFLIIMYFLYLTVTKRALDIFNCNPTTPSDGYLYTEFTSMKCDGGGLCRCDEKGGVQQSLVPASYAFIVLYSFGFPLFTFFVIYTNKTKIMEDQYLRAYGIGDTRETNPDAYDLRKKYHLLYMYYKPRTPYWLLAILFRKFMIVMSSLMFRGNPTFQMSVMLLVLFWSFVMQARFRPFLSSGEKGVVIKELEARAANAINDPAHFQADYEMLKKVTTAVRLGAEAERRAKENKYQRKNENFWDKDVTNIARKNRTTAKVAQEYFFDFNTVELILLGCSIFICLCGIMFHSNRYSTRKDTTSERDALAYILILVVVFSFIYLILIVLGEIAPWITARLARYFLKHNDAMIQKQLDEGVVTNENPLLNAKVIGAHNAEDLTRAIESNINALQKTKEQNKQLEADLRKMKMTT